MKLISSQVNTLQDQAPIFIGGPERSGKTYMRFMLDAHPNIALSRRTNMWTHFYGNFGDLSRSENLERCLQIMMQRTHIRRLAPEVDIIRHEFIRGPQTYARLFMLIHKQYAERVGKSRWGDQTELIERCADSIFSAFPNAKMIQLIRDPRDRYEAICTRNRQAPGRIGQATAKWLYSESFARQNEQKYSGNYLIVQYETMVTYPEQTMQDVCTFLGEEFSPNMMTLGNVARFKQGGMGSIEPGKSPLSTEYIGRYRQSLSNREIAFIQLQAGSQMLKYGYTLEPIRFSIARKFRFYLGMWGLNVAQMTGWRALQSMRTRGSVWGGGQSWEVRHASQGTTN